MSDSVSPSGLWLAWDGLTGADWVDQFEPPVPRAPTRVPIAFEGMGSPDRETLFGAACEGVAELWTEHGLIGAFVYLEPGSSLDARECTGARLDG